MAKTEKPMQGIKIRILHPTKEQLRLFKVNGEGARLAFNFARHEILKLFKQNFEEKMAYKVSLEKQGKSQKEIDELLNEWTEKNGLNKDNVGRDAVGKADAAFTQHKKGNPTYIRLREQKWYQGTGSWTIETVFKFALERFWDNLYKNTSRIKRKQKENPDKTYKYPQAYGFPRYKETIDGFATKASINKTDFENNRIYIDGVGLVQLSHHQPLLRAMFEKDKKDVRVITDGVHWYVTFSYSLKFKELGKQQTEVIGVDLGQKELAITSDGRHFKNITKDEGYKRIQRKINKKQKEICWKVTHNPKSYNIEDKKEQWKLAESNHIKKLQNQVRKLYIKLNNYKQNYFHNIAEEILKDNPRGLILETLNISGMKKNKKMAKALQQTAMSEFGRILEWHATKHKIPVKRAERWYASTQTCNHCGKKNVKMKGFENLKKRVFKCPVCGYVEQRDVNAALNLKDLYDKIETVMNTKIYYEDIKNVS